MNQFLTTLKAYFSSDYLRAAIWLFAAGYIAAYILALMLSRAPRADRTLMFHCRRAWGIALLVHALFVTGFAIHWWLHFGYFASFWSYFPWYLGMIVIDGCIIAAAMISIDRYSNYHQ